MNKLKKYDVKLILRENVNRKYRQIKLPGPLIGDNYILYYIYFRFEFHIR